MAISSTTSKNQYTANGSNTVFAYTFKIFDDDDIRVLVGDTVKTKTTDYSVSGVGSSTGGNITFVTAPANGAIVTNKRNEPLTQEIDYVDADDFPAAAHEEGLDRSVIRDQYLQEQISRTILLPEGSTLTGVSYPSPEANKVIAWNGTATGLVNVGIDGGVSGNQSIVGNLTVTGSTNLTNLTTTGDITCGNNFFTKSLITHLDSTAGTDQKRMEFNSSGTVAASMRTVNDAYTQASEFFTVTRTSGSHLINGMGFRVDSNVFNFNSGFTQTYATTQSNQMYLNATTSPSQTIATRRYFAKDNASNIHQYAETQVECIDNVNGSEDGSYNIWASIAGTLTKVADFAASITFRRTLDSTTRQIAIARGVFDGTSGSPTFASGSHNFASITKLGTGTYEIIMTNAAPDTNYAIIGTGRRVSPNNEAIISVNDSGAYAITTTQFAIECRNASGALFDSNRISIMVI